MITLTIIGVRDLAGGLSTDPKHLRRFLRKWFTLSGRDGGGKWQWELPKAEEDLKRVVYLYAQHYGGSPETLLTRIMPNPQVLAREASADATVAKKVLILELPQEEIVPRVLKWWPLGMFEPKIAELCASVLRGANYKVSLMEVSFQGKVWGQPHIYGTKTQLAAAGDVWYNFRQKHV